MLRNFNIKVEATEICDNPVLIEEENSISNCDFMVTRLKNEHYDLPSVKQESVLPIESIYVQEASVPFQLIIYYLRDYV